MDKIRVGIVDYLNTKPLLFGIQHSSILQEIELFSDYPSRIADLLLEGRIDIGLVPVVVIPQLQEYHIVSDYCISSDGPVASVALFSEVDIHEIKEVLLDYQSRTSVALLKILLKEYWKIQPKFIETKADFRSRIKGSTAGLIIGDRALEQRQYSPYIFDLGEAWQKFSNLPFLYAAWVSNRPVPESFMQAFNDANRRGVENTDKAVKANPYPFFDLKQYYTKNIRYTLDQRALMGMEKFLSYLGRPAVKMQ